jgi:hypothetical protein
MNAHFLFQSQELDVQLESIKKISSKDGYFATQSLSPSITVETLAGENGLTADDVRRILRNHMVRSSSHSATGQTPPSSHNLSKNERNHVTSNCGALDSAALDQMTRDTDAVEASRNDAAEITRLLLATKS